MQPVRFERVNHCEHIVLSDAEDRRIRHETKAIYQILMETAAHVFKTRDYAHFAFSPLLIAAMERSYAVKEPMLLGRFDLRYHPDVPVTAFELNILHASFLAEKLRYDLTASSHTVACKSSLRECWLRAEQIADGRSMRYLAEEQDWDAEAVVSFAPRSVSVPIGPLTRPASSSEQVRDPFWTQAYVEAAADTLLLPAAWTLLIENKAIWAHAWRLFPRHPNLLPTFFTPEEALAESDVIRCKPIFDCSGRGQFNATAEQRCTRRGYVFQPFAPTPDFGPESFIAYGFVTGAGAISYLLDHCGRSTTLSASQLKAQCRNRPHP